MMNPFATLLERNRPAPRGMLGASRSRIEMWVADRPVLVIAPFLLFLIIVTSSVTAQDYTDDPAIVTSSGPIVDAFDFMIWNHHKFTTNPGGSGVGDGNADGVVDGADLAIWNSSKWSGTGCITDAQYETAFALPVHGVAVANVPLGGPGPVGSPSFTVTPTGAGDDLSIAVPSGFALRALTVYSPTAASTIGADFTTGLHFPPIPPYTVDNMYFHSREQWVFLQGGYAGSGLLATFPTGGLANVSVFWQVEDATGSVLTGTTGGSWSCVPEPASAKALIGWLAYLLFRRRASCAPDGPRLAAAHA